MKRVGWGNWPWEHKGEEHVLTIYIVTEPPQHLHVRALRMDHVGKHRRYV